MDTKNNKENKLQEQDAPLKNTDNAFVQVSKDGSPALPEQDKQEEDMKPNRTTDMDKR